MLILKLDGKVSKLFFLIIFFYTSAFASDLSKKIEIVCEQTTRCENLKKQLADLSKLKEVNPLTVMKLLLRDGKIFSPVYRRIGDRVILEVEFKPVIQTVKITSKQKKDLEIVERSLDVNIGEIYDSEKLKRMNLLVLKYLSDIGYNSPVIKAKVENQKNSIAINFDLDLGKPSVVKKINIKSKYNWIIEFYNQRLQVIKDKPFNFNNFKKLVDSINLNLREYGHYLIDYDIDPQRVGNDVEINLNLSNEELYIFDFKNKLIGKRIASELISKSFAKYKSSFDSTKLIEELKLYLYQKGYVEPKIVVKDKNYLNSFNIKTILRTVEVQFGERTKVRGVFFKGNFFFSEAKLKQMFYSDAFDLASRDLFDPEYYKFFASNLRREYIRNGFVQNDLNKNNFIFSRNKEFVDLVFTIKEGVRAFVDTIEIKGVDKNLESLIKSKMKTKSNESFDPLSFEKDLIKVLDMVRDEGFYNARIVNVKDENMVVYSADYTNVKINLEVELDKKIILKNLYYVGNERTKSFIIEREVPIKKNDLITPNVVKKIKSNLNNLGLFKTVSVNPLMDESNSSETDLVITVEEKPYQVYELAPGFRTDLGFKLSFKADSLNVWGRNHTLSFQSQVNRRISNEALDLTRANVDQNFIESSVRLNFLARDVIKGVDNNTSISYQERRFYSFDAKINRFNNTVSTNLTNRLATSIRYQFEDIKQFDATDLLDEGQFRIGAFTSSFVYDLRNKKINPTRGSFYNFSVEYAHPNFKSDENVEFYKVVSRNNFYLPISNWVMAFYVSLGYQQNLAGDNTSIPDIKAFRLTGSDTVRGFDFEEINRLSNGDLLANSTFSNDAYLINLKFEPRYYINDNMVMGFFYDAGRVFLEKPDFSDLRSSVGLTFKYLTPVGSLDFDYGLKTLRKKNSDGTLESPGRIHISIGFF